MSFTEDQLFNIATLVIGVVGTWFTKGWIQARSSQRSDFQEIIDANTKLREEVRKELREAKSEIAELKLTVSERDGTIETLKTQISELRGKNEH